MVKITFDYDTETKSVTNIKVTDLPVSTPSKGKQSKTDSNTVILNGSSLKLNQEVMELLQVGPSERLCVRFNGNPIVATPKALGESNGGNLITKSMTIACKGKVGETLASYGTEFTYKLESPGYLVLYSSDAEQDIQEIEKIDSVIGDSDFTSCIKDGKEVDFDFSIKG